MYSYHSIDNMRKHGAQLMPISYRPIATINANLAPAGVKRIFSVSTFHQLLFVSGRKQHISMLIVHNQASGMRAKSSLASMTLIKLLGEASLSLQ